MTQKFILLQNSQDLFREGLTIIGANAKATVLYITTHLYCLLLRKGFAVFS